MNSIILQNQSVSRNRIFHFIPNRKLFSLSIMIQYFSNRWMFLYQYKKYHLAKCVSIVDRKIKRFFCFNVSKDHRVKECEIDKVAIHCKIEKWERNFYQRLCLNGIFSHRLHYSFLFSFSQSKDNQNLIPFYYKQIVCHSFPMFIQIE